MALPPPLLMLGTAYSLHVVAEYYELDCPERTVRGGLLEILRLTTPPIFITALTTVLGFLSLEVNPILSIQRLGVFSSIWVTLSFFLSTPVVPALLAALPLPTNTEDTLSPMANAILQQAYIDTLPGVDKTVSIVDYCELIDRRAQSGEGTDIIVSPEGEIISGADPTPRANG